MMLLDSGLSYCHATVPYPSTLPYLTPTPGSLQVGQPTTKEHNYFAAE